MEAELRREHLVSLMQNSKKPITGSSLAKHFGVSRQIIVQDIAILRAAGEQVLATPQGYLIPSCFPAFAARTVIACCHSREQIEQEIGIIIDLGGKVIDVVVEHPVYGDLRGNLMIASRRDLNLFIKKLQTTRANPLSALTGGVHLHTIDAPCQSSLAEIMESLKEAGFLVC